MQRYVASGAVPSIRQGDDGFLKAPLVFDPGSRWEYGINTDLLGKLVENVSGQTLAEYFRQHIFHPLGMTDTFFDAPLEKQGHVVSVAGNGQEALLALTREPFDLVLMDVQMPEMDGFEATAHVRRAARRSQAVPRPRSAKDDADHQQERCSAYPVFVFREGNHLRSPEGPILNGKYIHTLFSRCVQARCSR